jgi:hypothetical protein
MSPGRRPDQKPDQMHHMRKNGRLIMSLRDLYYHVGSTDPIPWLAASSRRQSYEIV